MVERKKSEPVHTGPLTEAQRKLLPGYVAEIERTEDEIAVLKLDLKGIYEAAKIEGIDPAALKQLVRERRQDPEQLWLFRESVDQYHWVMKQADKPHASMIDRPFAPPLEDADTNGRAN